MRNPEKLGFFFKLEKNRPTSFDKEERCVRWTVGLQLAHHIHCYSDAFCEHNLLNHLSTYLKLHTRKIPVKWMELFMCLKLDTCLNARQDGAHNPLNIVFSSCTWSLVNENTYSHRAIHTTLPILSLWHSFQAIRSWVRGEDDFAAHWRCRPPWALFAGYAAESAVLGKMSVLGEGFGTNVF